MVKHPMQPIVWDRHHVLRFKENAIVQHLFQVAPLAMQDIADMDFDWNDRAQFVQMLGYSVGNAKDLGHLPKKLIAEADAICEKMLAKKRKRK